MTQGKLCGRLVCSPNRQKVLYGFVESPIECAISLSNGEETQGRV